MDTNKITKNIITTILLLFSLAVFGQNNAVKGSGVVYTNGQPTLIIDPVFHAEVAIDTATGLWWEYSRDGLGWIEAGFRVQKFPFSIPPTVAPLDKQSEVVLNDVDSLYRWRAGAWRHINGVLAYTAGTGINIVGTTINNTGDLSDTNEGILGVGAGSGTTSILLSNTTGATGVTITASTGLTIAETTSSNGGSITLTNSAPDQTVSISNGTGINVTGTYPNFTVTNTGDLSATNELQVFTNSSDATNHYLVLSDGGGSMTIAEGAGITLTTSGTGSDGIVTISASGGSGTVTSVGLSLPSIFSVSGSPVTTSGTLTGTLANQSANVVFSGPTTGGAATPTFRSLVTADLANQIVTYAKVQNVTANKLLGRSNSGAGSMEEITLGTGLSYTGTTLNVSGFPTGTGVANRFALWTGTSTIGSDAAFTFDGTNDRATFTGTIAGSGANNAILNLNTGSITGTTEFLRMSGNINGVMASVMSNANNASGSASTIMQLLVGGTSAGDPIMQFSVPGGSGTVAMGIDNSSTGDKFFITPNSATPGGNANASLVITQDATPLFGINKDSPTEELDVAGDIQARSYINTGNLWNNGLCTFGTGAGTAPTAPAVVLLTGGNSFFVFEFSTGSAPVANAAIATLTYPNAFPGNSVPVLFPRGNTTATDINKFFIQVGNNNTLILQANGALAFPATYRFLVHVGGRN